MTACGGEEAPRSTATVAISTVDPSREAVALRAPATVAAGPVEIVLRNRGDTLHDAQLFRTDGTRTADDVVHALETADNEPTPRWLHPAGGVAPIRPGETARTTQVLEPGTYFVADTQERPDPSGGRSTNAVKGGIARIEATGDGGGELPRTAATITAREYGYRTAGLVAGRNRVTFRNAGREHHQAVALPVPAGVPFAVGKRRALERRTGTGWVPVDAPHDRATTVLEGGGEQVAELDLRPGRYLLVCFVSDRAGGGPQWALGMADRLDVPRRPADGRP